jgi:aldehyde dehydrogenase (NAD+)
MGENHLNFIGGTWVEPSTGEYFENRNPAAWSELIGMFPRSGEEDVNAAVAAARAAFDDWRRTPAPIRGEIITRAGEIMKARKEELAVCETREMGKVLNETRGDVQEGIDTAYVVAGEGRRLFGMTTHSELRDKFGMCMRVPIGVVGAITPWNFPLAIPTWKLFPALLSGNTVVLKPASDTPHTCEKFVEILMEAGIPPGVVNLVHGTGSGVGSPLASHPDVDVVTFTGSSAVGKEISEIGGRMLKRVSCELGGKNAQIVMDDADLELALEGVLWGAFGTTGQRCTATSRLIVHESVHDELVERVVARASALRLGNGLEDGVDVGPLVNEGRRTEVHEYVQIGQAEGASLRTGGAFATGDGLDDGWFYQPTVFSGVDRNMRIAREEIFGPVLSVISVSSFEEAVDVLNDTDYGLSGSIYTRDVDRAFKAMQEINTGIVYINAPTIGAETHLPFGGTKDTGNGHREAGIWAFDVFTEWRTVYVDYSGSLQKAQIDTE